MARDKRDRCRWCRVDDVEVGRVHDLRSGHLVDVVVTRHVEHDLVAGYEQVEIQERMTVRDPVAREHGVPNLARERASRPMAGTVINDRERDALVNRGQLADLRY